MTLDSVAATNPSSASGSCSHLISSGTSPCSPRSMVCSSVRSARFQKWSLRPYASVGDVLEVETRLVCVRLAELRRDEDVLARLVPEVVVEGRPLAAVLPAALDLERLRVEAGEAARAVPVCISEHRRRRRCRPACSGRCVAASSRSRARPRPARSPSRRAGAEDRRPRSRRESATSGSRASIRWERSGRGRQSCSGSSRSGATRRPRSASASRGRRGRPRRRPRPGSPELRRRCPRAGRRRRGTPPGGACCASRGEA